MKNFNSAGPSELQIPTAEINCHIHKINPQYLQKELTEKIISASSPQARTIKNIAKGDLILFLTPVPAAEKIPGPSKKLMFVATAEVENTFESQQHFVGYDLSPLKIAIKNIAYFNAPINGDEYVKIAGIKNTFTPETQGNMLLALSGPVENKLEPESGSEPNALYETYSTPQPHGEYAVKENLTISDLIKAEYKKIERYDYLLLNSHSPGQSAQLPEYLKAILENAANDQQISEPTQKYSKTEMIEIFKMSLDIYKKIKKKETNVLITDFLDFVKNNFDTAGIYKSIEQIRESYSKLAINLKFDHIHTRESSKSFPVIDKFGKEVRFGYIRLKSEINS